MNIKCSKCRGKKCCGVNPVTHKNLVCPVCRGRGFLTPALVKYLQEYRKGAKRFLEGRLGPPNPMSQTMQYSGYVAMNYSCVVHSATQYDVTDSQTFSESNQAKHPDWVVAGLKTHFELRRIKLLLEQTNDD